MLFSAGMVSGTAFSPITVSQKNQRFLTFSGLDETDYFRTIMGSGLGARFWSRVWRDNRCRSPDGPKPG